VCVSTRTVVTQYSGLDDGDDDDDDGGHQSYYIQYSTFAFFVLYFAWFAFRSRPALCVLYWLFAHSSFSRILGTERMCVCTLEGGCRGYQ
jgi:hypothetical protein